MWSMFLYICVFSMVSHESATFDILYNDRVVGEMTAVREQIGNQVIYRNTTTVRTRVIRQIEVQYQSRVVYQDGILQEATVKSLLNGDIYDDVQTRKADKQYEFYKNGKLKHTLEGPITYSAARMLFDEPNGVSKVYSEEGGAFNTIKANETTKYSKVNSKGRTNYYHYEKQRLKKIEIDAGLVAFQMIRKP